MMKIKYLLVLLLIPVAGCHTPQAQTESKTTSGEFEFEIIRIGECQYVGRNFIFNNATLTHKGDCDNPIHVYNKVETNVKITPPVISK